MVKRSLTDLEKNISLKGIERLKKEINHLQFLLEYNDLMLNRGLYENYQEKLNEFKGVRQQLINDMKLNYDKIATLREQIDKGVEIKNVKMVGDN